MPATKTPFACGHRGYGGYCHRCKAAEKLEQEASKATEGKEKLLAEAARLRARA